MKNTMNDNTAKFPLVRLSYQFCIRSNGIKADKHISIDLFTTRIIKGNDVGEIIVLQILTIYFNNFFIVTENIVKRTNHAVVVSGYAFNPLLNCFKWQLLRKNYAISEPLEVCFHYKSKITCKYRKILPQNQ